MGWRSVAYDHRNGAIKAIFEFLSLSRVIGLTEAKNEHFWLRQNWLKWALFSQYLRNGSEIQKSPRWRHLYPHALYFATQKDQLLWAVWAVRGGATVFGPSSSCISSSYVVKAIKLIIIPSLHQFSSLFFHVWSFLFLSHHTSPMMEIARHLEICPFSL